MPSLWLDTKHTLNIAHQGASAVAPSNTLAAFRRADELGADGIELDVHLSADGIPVVIHDFTLDRTTDGTGPVANLPLAALRQLDAGSWFGPAFAKERMPTLEEVFVAVGQRLLINVELKVLPGKDRGLEKAVTALVGEHNLLDRVLVSSFNPFALRRVRHLAPHIPLGLLYESTPISWLARALAWLMRDLRPEAVHPYWRLAHPFTVRYAHDRGRRVVAWTVDDPRAMRLLVERGVDGIITNRPDHLRQVLEAT